MELSKRTRNDLFPGYSAYASIALKVALNALSTGAQVLAGRVLSNRMINVTPSNQKLFLRCTGLVSLFGGVNMATAKINLCKALYQTDHISEEILNAPVSAHLKQGASSKSIRLADRVLPVAILMSATGLAFNESRDMLLRYDTVRGAIEAAVRPIRSRDILKDIGIPISFYFSAVILFCFCARSCVRSQAVNFLENIPTDTITSPSPSLTLTLTLTLTPRLSW